jgi:transcriptional regulator with XRE-family HTH domain
LSIQKVSVRQIKAARELLGWSQEAIANASGVSIPTIKRLEAAGGDLGGRPETSEKIVAALEKVGVEFLDDGQGVRLKIWKIRNGRGKVPPPRKRKGK